MAAELAAYSGFSANNYLEVPYSSDFDFGTGDFCIMGWVKATAWSGVQAIAARSAAGTSGGLWMFGAEAGVLKFWESSGTYGAAAKLAASSAMPASSWVMIAAVRSNGVLSLWRDGKSVATPVSFTSNVNHTTPRLFIGYEGSRADWPLTNGSIALLRISATAPTPEQIRAIYEQEKVLFQENAMCLAPNSNHTSMSYDEEEDLLYATTSGGAYILKGIQVLNKVIDNNTVYTGITASGNITSKWTSTGANTFIPSIYPFRSEIDKVPRKLYERNKIKSKTYTDSATPKVIYHVPFAEGEEGTFITRTIGVNRADGTQIGSYEHKYTARRINGSANVALIGSSNTVIQEVTSSMDVIVSNTRNYITLSYTGLASNTIEWVSYTEGTFND